MMGWRKEGVKIRLHQFLKLSGTLCNLMCSSFNFHQNWKDIFNWVFFCSWPTPERRMQPLVRVGEISDLIIEDTELTSTVEDGNQEGTGDPHPIPTPLSLVTKSISPSSKSPSAQASTQAQWAHTNRPCMHKNPYKNNIKISIRLVAHEFVSTRIKSREFLCWKCQNRSQSATPTTLSTELLRSSAAGVDDVAGVISFPSASLPDFICDTWLLNECLKSLKHWSHMVSECLSVTLFIRHKLT